MKTLMLTLCAVIGLAQIVGTANADTTHHRRHHKIVHHKTVRHTAPKNEISKIDKDRKTDPTVRQVTPDPNKSPGEHTNNLSKNVNHEANREAKDVDRTVGDARDKDHTTRQVTPDPHKSPAKHADNLSKNVNHEANRESKDFNHAVNNASKSINHALSGKKK
jgi:hypothetical protein